MKKLFLGLLALLVAAGAALYALKDTLIKTAVEKAVAQTTGCEMTIQSLQVRPFSQSVTIKGVHLMNPAGFEEKEALNINEIALSLDLASIFSERIHVKSAVLDVAQITIVQRADGSSNLDLIGKRSSSETSEQPTEQQDGQKTEPGESEKPEKTKKPSKGFLIDTLTLRMGKAELVQYSEDQPKPEKKEFSVNKERTYTQVSSVEQLIGDITADVLMDQGLRALNDWAKDNSDKLGVKKEEIDKATQVIGGFLNSLKSK